MLFRHGWNAVQVQKHLGHHRPSFTLDTYVHLLDKDLPEPPRMGSRATDATAAAEAGNRGVTEVIQTAREGGAVAAAENPGTVRETLGAVGAL